MHKFTPLKQDIFWKPSTYNILHPFFHFGFSFVLQLIESQLRRTVCVRSKENLSALKGQASVKATHVPLARGQKVFFSL